MTYTHKIKKAIAFAVDTHSRQKRKGKNTPYVVHPLTVGLILSCAGANENVIAAGILHDTIEDSPAEKKVSVELLTHHFGKEVADIVLSVTETNKELSWVERKKRALEHIKTFSKDSLLVKSADVMSNCAELADDYERDGDEVFERFNAPKDKILQGHLRVIVAIISRWPESPLTDDLRWIADQLQMIGSSRFMQSYSAPIIKYRDYDENKELECPVCGWRGVAKANTDSHFALEVSCLICDKMLLVASYPPYDE